MARKTGGGFHDLGSEGIEVRSVVFLTLHTSHPAFLISPRFFHHVKNFRRLDGPDALMGIWRGTYQAFARFVRLVSGLLSLCFGWIARGGWPPRQVFGLDDAVGKETLRCVT